MRRSTKKLQLLVGWDNWWCALSFARPALAWSHFTSHLFLFPFSFFCSVCHCYSPHAMEFLSKAVGWSTARINHLDLFLPVPHEAWAPAWRDRSWPAPKCLQGYVPLMPVHLPSFCSLEFLFIRSIFTRDPVGVTKSPQMLGGAVVDPSHLFRHSSLIILIFKKFYCRENQQWRAT